MATVVSGRKADAANALSASPHPAAEADGGRELGSVPRVVLADRPSSLSCFGAVCPYGGFSSVLSLAATRDGFDSKMMAMSLSMPSTSLDGTQPFTPPKPLRADKAGPEGTAFLWQAPTSDAVLFMGERWVELHSYVSQVLDKQHTLSAPPALLAQKEVGKKYPAWMEYALQLSRLRGYFTLYPSKQTAGAIVGVHTDLPDKPEEYQEQVASKEREPDKLVDQASEEFDAASQVDMLKTLPHNGDHQLPNDLPLLSWDGRQKSLDTFARDATQYATDFRREVGQCGEEELKKQPLARMDARDLFCNTKGQGIV
ncbi:Uncharacterized protein TCAP_06306 [Tolypocladium capitatum]|uniref:Uncharacterized protein n=1 Tax=Tolypocladium capitatum TaxID=45235 RepID=A0A2K3Q880_9HYPO|nr:Uncharacterized protein TCAP_06306 [Tolypocladium capitatum]